MSAVTDDLMNGAVSAADALPIVDVQPVGGPAERIRAAIQSDLCQVADTAGMLHSMLSVAPENDPTIELLTEQFSEAVVRVLLALERFKSARGCAGEA